MQPSKTFIYLAYLCLLPLVLALFLALASFFEWPFLTGKTLAFARISSYIYAHSYGVILLSFFSGIQIGMVLDKPKTQFYLVFNFLVMIFSWVSFKSFADMNGMILLLFCQIAASMADQSAGKNNLLKPRYVSMKLKINSAVICLLLALILINR